MDADVCYRAIKARDARFDGLFFTAVRTTGIFCRPVCPARTPLRQNVEFFPNAAAAQAAGYRPCLRCRPEVSPDLPASAGSSSTVNRALRLINEGALDNGSTAQLADRLGLTDRHLRRLFLEHVGVPPIVVAETRRLLFAKKLITETHLAFADIAFASGYRSLRRFNEAFRDTYQRSPMELRRLKPPDGGAQSAIELKLNYRPPYDWSAFLHFVGRRAIAGLEVVSDDCYRRNGISVRHNARENCLIARIDSDNVSKSAAGGRANPILLRSPRELRRDCRALEKVARPKRDRGQVRRVAAARLLGSVRTRGARDSRTASHGSRREHAGGTPGRAVRTAARRQAGRFRSGGHRPAGSSGGVPARPGARCLRRKRAAGRLGDGCGGNRESLCRSRHRPLDGKLYRHARARAIRMSFQPPTWDC